MNAAILQTKLYIPQTRTADMVMRPRLVAQMDQSLTHKLTLVSAPAGFGKTTLVSTWLAHRQPATAWLSLDEQDNDLNRFLHYVMAALQTVHPALGRGLSERLDTGQQPAEALLTPFLNEMGKLEVPLLLVLEDYHEIENPAVDQAVAFVLDHAPPHLHLIITSRVEPDLPLARLRVRRQLTEIRAGDLRLTQEEAVNFFRQIMGLDLTTAQITALEARTEGWIAGLQLAALSLQGRADTAEFVANFTGSHRFVMDYLADEVLNNQPSAIKEFLLHTSILERMCAALCDALTPSRGEHDPPKAQRVLEQLEQANLFLVPLDDRRVWYRYHHLFADLLQHRLAQTASAQVAKLHLGASQWLAANGFLAEAIHHVLLSEDEDEIERVFVLAARESLITARFSQTLRWFSQLPEALATQRPRLQLYWGWLHLFLGQEHEAAVRLAHAEDMQPAADDRATSALQQGLAGFLAMHTNHPAQAVSQLRDAQQLAPPDDELLRNLFGMLEARAKVLAGDLEGGLQLLVEVIARSPAMGNARVMLDAYSTLDGLFNQHGAILQTLTAAQRLIDRFEAAGDEQPAGMGWMYLALGQHAYHSNDLTAAMTYLEKGLACVARSGEWMAHAAIQMELIRLHHTLGRQRTARQIISQLRQHIHQAGDLLGIFTDSAELLLAVREGNLTHAAQVADQLGLSSTAYISPALDVTYLIYARLLLAQGAHEDAQRVLTAVEQIDQDLGYPHRLLVNALLQALCAHAKQDSETAVQHLERAVALGAPLGYTRLFLDEDPAIAEYLPAVRAVAPAFVDQLLKLFGRQQQQLSPLIEPLTDREVEVLNLIATGRSNRQISDNLIISVGTVKKHTASIFGKLQVSNRTEAVAKARELGLL
ncbi:MAG: LuxR C-terminal-related transcriptional regulator [Caldilineaceae bacterium]